jgi:hypothetical protein
VLTPSNENGVLNDGSAANGFSVVIKDCLRLGDTPKVAGIFNRVLAAAADGGLVL